MSNQRILQIYDRLDDNEKKRVVERLTLVLRGFNVSPAHVRQLLEGVLPRAPRLFQHDLKNLVGFMEEEFPGKANISLRRLTQGQQQLAGVRARVAGFLRPSQMGALATASTKAHRSFYEQTIPMLQQVRVDRLRRPVQFLKKLPDFRSLKTLELGHDFVIMDFNVARVLADGLPHLKSLKVLDLQNARLTADVAVVLFPSFAGLTGLTSLHLGYNPDLGDVGLDGLARVLPQMRKLRVLGLSAVGARDEGAVELSGALPHLADLRALYMSDNYIGDRGANAVASSIRGLKRLQDFSMGGLVRDDGAVALASAFGFLPELKFMTLKNNEVADWGVRALASSLGPSLSSFSVGARVRPTGARALARQFHRAPNLTELDLGNNILGDAGVAEIVAHIRHLPKLVVLNLCDNGLGVNAMRSLATGFTHTPALQTLVLDDNPRIGDQGFEVLSPAFRLLPRLRVLHLSNTGLGNEGAWALAVGIGPIFPQLSIMNIESNNRLGVESMRALAWLYGNVAEF